MIGGGLKMGKRRGEKKKGVILHVFLSYHNSICQPAPPKKKQGTAYLKGWERLWSVSKEIWFSRLVQGWCSNLLRRWP